MKKGSYGILFELEGDVEVKVGSLGVLKLKEGFYVYNGSAFGPGGLKRVERHLEAFNTGEVNQHWHIDYLSQIEEANALSVYYTEGKDLECYVSNELEGERVEGFGCSDCDCTSHLIYSGDYESLKTQLESFYEAIWNF